jgi:signal recognition particle subunit SEC65
MQEMQQQMESSQDAMSMEMEMQNLESLRQIIHGLIKISFDQENLIKQFRELEQNDPRFNVLAQQQLKLKDDVKVLEDSLLELSKKDAMMSSFVTREVTELNTRIDKVIDANKERRRQQASTEMQFSMTAINNLALMLDSHFDMMMKMMQNAKPGKGKSKNGKQSLGQMQQQLNRRIEELKGSGKQGRELSEELAEMAAEQERIRRALQEMQEKMKNENGGKMPGGDLSQKMEETETELVNKQLTDKLIERQKEILTRLLESEKSVREQDLDEERKGETAKDYEKEIPPAVEEYLRLKEKEVELLKTVPPKLYPYYKKEVSEYFKRIGGNK